MDSFAQFSTSKLFPSSVSLNLHIQLLSRQLISSFDSYSSLIVQKLNASKFCSASALSSGYSLPSSDPDEPFHISVTEFSFQSDRSLSGTKNEPTQLDDSVVLKLEFMLNFCIASTQTGKKSSHCIQWKLCKSDMLWI